MLRSPLTVACIRFCLVQVTGPGCTYAGWEGCNLAPLQCHGDQPLQHPTWPEYAACESSHDQIACPLSGCLQLLLAGPGRAACRLTRLAALHRKPASRSALRHPQQNDRTNASMALQTVVLVRLGGPCTHLHASRAWQGHADDRHAWHEQRRSLSSQGAACRAVIRHTSQLYEAAP